MRRLFKKSGQKNRIKNKHLLIIMVLFCISLMIATFSSDKVATPFQGAAGIFIVPFEKAADQGGQWLVSIRDMFTSKEKLLAEKEKLEKKVDTLTAENNYLLQQQTDLAGLKELYQLDQEYSSYPKIMATIIAKDPGSWYTNFTIDKGYTDGVKVNSNVLAGKGLAGIVTEVGPNWANVECIINDTCSVSAKTVGNGTNCIVEGDLELIDSGLIVFSELYDPEGSVTVGERLVTSHISEKYMEGLFIGYIASVEQDTNNLTKRGTLVTPVDFRHLKEVLVLTCVKGDN